MSTEWIFICSHYNKLVQDSDLWHRRNLPSFDICSKIIPKRAGKNPSSSPFLSIKWDLIYIRRKNNLVVFWSSIYKAPAWGLILPGKCGRVSWLCSTGWSTQLPPLPGERGGDVPNPCAANPGGRIQRFPERAWVGPICAQEISCKIQNMFPTLERVQGLSAFMAAPRWLPLGWSYTNIWVQCKIITRRKEKKKPKQGKRVGSGV